MADPQQQQYSDIPAGYQVLPSAPPPPAYSDIPEGYKVLGPSVSAPPPRPSAAPSASGAVGLAGPAAPPPTPESIISPQPTFQAPQPASARLSVGPAPARRSIAEGLTTEELERQGGMPLTMTPSGVRPVPLPTQSLSETAGKETIHPPSSLNGPFTSREEEQAAVQQKQRQEAADASIPQNYERVLEAGRKAGEAVGTGAAILATGKPQTIQTPTGPAAVLPNPASPAEAATVAREHPAVAGIAKAAGGFAGQMAADPMTYVFMGSSELVSPVLDRVISTGFRLGLGVHAIDAARDLKKNWDSYSPEKRYEVATDAGLSGALALGAHAVRDMFQGSPELAEKNNLLREARDIASTAGLEYPYDPTVDDLNTNFRQFQARAANAAPEQQAAMKEKSNRLQEIHERLKNIISPAPKYSDVPQGYQVLPPAPATEAQPVHHASNDIEALRTSAEKQAPKVGDALAKATEGVPGAEVEAVRDSKDTGRIEDKAERQGVQPSQIGDVLAGKVTVPDQKAADQVLTNLNQQMPVESAEGSVTGQPGKNDIRQTQAIVNTGAPAGEPVKKAEVMLQTPEMAKAAEETHDDYRKAQELRAAGKEQEAAALEQKIAERHQEAEQAARARQEGTNAVQKPSTSSVDGGAQEAVGEKGSQRGRVGEGERRQETAGASAQEGLEQNLKHQAVEVRDAEGNWRPGTVLADVVGGGNNGIRRLRGEFTDDRGGKFDNLKIQDVRRPNVVASEKHPDVGVDFDGTLFTQREDGQIGEPIPERIASVKKLLAEGKSVVIETRRVQGRPEEVKNVQDALEKAGLPRLPVTDLKTAKVLIDNQAHHAPTNQNTPLPVPVDEVHGPSGLRGKSEGATVPSGGAGTTEQLSGGVSERQPEVRNQPERAEEKPEPKYKFGNTQTPIPATSEAGKSLATARERISKDDLMPTEFGGGTEGLENDPHVTVRYGIKGEDFEGIKKFLSQQAPFEATLGKTEKFEPNEHTEGAAVIQAPVRAPELHRLNAELEKHGDFIEPTFPEYKPHATLAYVKPDKADRYVGMTVTEGKKFPVDQIAITDRNGNQHIVKLEGKKQPTNEERLTQGKAPIPPAKKPVTPQVEPQYSYGLPSFVGAGHAEKKPNLSAHLLDKITAGEMPKDNPALRKMVEAFDGKAVEPARMKQAQEALEVAVVGRARQIVEEGAGGRQGGDELPADIDQIGDVVRSATLPHVGLRMLADDLPEIQEGDILPASNDWVIGIKGMPDLTGSKADGGTSAIEVPRNDIYSELKHRIETVQQYEGGRLAVLESAEAKDGRDFYEIRMVKPRVLAVFGGKTSTRSTFDKLVDLYNSQPNLNVRTSTSIENQAYSTPAPLAFLADKLAGVDKKASLYEPTAGNGMLTITADPKKVRVNELNPERADALRKQGFGETTDLDAVKIWDEPAAKSTLGKQYDAVVTNPPFGPLPDEVRHQGYKIGQLDHLIAARSLDAMKDNGKATLILGASKFQPGRQGTDDKIFFNWLYSHYNVVGQFEVDGKLYGRQGAAWPVRVIAIDGRSTSEATRPAPESIQQARTWDEAFQQYRQIMDARPAALPQREGAGSAVQRQEPNEPRPVRNASEGTPAKPNREEPRAGATGAVEQPRPPAGPVRDSNAGKSEPLARPDTSLRPDADVARSDELAKGQPREPKPERTADARGIHRSDNELTSSENQYQAPYSPASGKKDVGVLIPKNMKQPLEHAMAALEDKVGDIDKFAQKELGYKSEGDLHDALMGLQVDSVAAAIEAMKRGKAVIIADQTGIGKGRQAASIIRWAIKNGDIPVFVTKQPSLFTDMFGDLSDIDSHDIKPFIMNADEWITLPDGSRAFTNKPGQQGKVLDQITREAKLPEGRNAMFTTYSQVNVPNRQQQALRSLAPRAIVILDESHNAGGESNTGEYFRDLLANAKGVTYLSATYAKRPDNMPLYFKTDMGEAVADSGTLIQAMKDGGLPLQTVVSNNLVKAGQMFRRERSYDGVRMDTKVDTDNRTKHGKMSDGATEALRAIVSADRAFHETYVAAAQEEARKENKRILKIEGGGNQASKNVQHTEFSAVVHNFVRQMLLGIKADTAADDAIAAIRRGEKPLIAVDNTMGSFLSAYVGDKGIREGDHLEDFDYGTVLSRALDRTRYLAETDEFGDKHKKYVPLGELDPVTREAYRQAQAIIDKLKLDLPVSPIDWIRHRIEDAGYSVAEITGRNLAVDYSTPDRPKLASVPTQEQNDKVETTRRFNDGRLDAIILNVSGSTGISLHASEKFADQRPRHMIVAQPAQDINIFMQMLGRIHRTGQVKLPRYTILNADLPAEKRPSALLSKKMKSLNANTSSNTESATSVKVPDMLNKYGDQVVANYLVDNPKLAKALGVDAMSDGGEALPDVARKATGRLALMPVKVQDEFYRDVEQQYNDLIHYLDSTNQNELEPKTFDYDAREEKSAELVPATNPDSPFGDAAVYNEYSIKAQGKPHSPEEVTDAIKEHLDGQTPKQHVKDLVGKLDGELTYYKQTLDLENPEQTAKAEEIAHVGRHFIESHPIGHTMRVEINGEDYKAAVTNIRSTHKGGGNPYSLSKINVQLATNGPMRTLSVPATQLRRIEVGWLMDKPEQLFREAKREGRETAKIITGNLLAAYGELKDTRGTIINFTKQDGTTEQGILLPKKFEVSENTKGDYRLTTPEHALKFLKKSINPRIEDIGIASRDGNVRVVNDGGTVQIITPKSKARGAKYFLDHNITDLTGDFVSQGNTMKVGLPKGKETAVLEQLMKKTALYASPSMVEEAKSFAPKQPGKAPERESLAAGESGSFNPAALNPAHIRNEYNKAIEEFISGKLKIGDKYFDVAKHDGVIANDLHLIDNAPRYFKLKADNNLDKVISGLTDDQVRLASMMVDSDSRDYIRLNKPDEYDAATNDPKVVAAVQAFKPLQDELAHNRMALGWPVRKSLHVEEDQKAEKPFVLKDRQGNDVLDANGDPVAFKTERAALKYADQNGTIEPHLKRTYPEHSKNPLPAETGAGEFTGTFVHEKGLRPPKMDKKAREMSAQYHYEHGRKDFSGYVESFKQVKTALMKQKLFDDFTDEAEKWTVGTAQPPKIEYNGQEYYRPDLAQKAKEGGTKLEQYAIYDPTRGERFLVFNPAEDWAQQVTGKPGIKATDRFLGPKTVVDAMENYDATRGGEASKIRRMFQTQIVGLFGPVVHINNILRHLGHATGLGTFDPRSWPSIAKVLASPELRARVLKGVDDATIDMLARQGAYTDWGDIGSLNAYIGGNLNPANWIRTFGKGILFDPKFAGGWGGLDPKARVVVADYFKDHYPKMTERQIADAVSDAFGNYNRANWTARQRMLAKFTLFPGWDTASAKWFLRHPFKVGIAGSLVVLAINLALQQLGLNKDEDSKDVQYVHIGDRKLSSGLINDSMGSHFMAPVLGALQAKLQGEDVAAGTSEGMVRGSSALSGTLAGPVVEMIADEVYNRKFAGGAAEIVTPEDKYTPGTWAPNVDLEKRIAFAALKGSPALNRFIDNQGHWDWAQGLGGAVLGITNYKYGAEERFKANVAKSAEYGKTLKELAEKNPDAASEFVKDPTRATYLMFHDDLESMSHDLKEIDQEIERVRGSDLPADERQKSLNDLKDNRNQLLKAADGLDDALQSRKSQARREQMEKWQSATATAQNK